MHNGGRAVRAALGCRQPEGTAHLLALDARRLLQLLQRSLIGCSRLQNPHTCAANQAFCSVRAFRNERNNGAPVNTEKHTQMPTTAHKLVVTQNRTEQLTCSRWIKKGFPTRFPSGTGETCHAGGPLHLVAIGALLVAQVARKTLPTAREAQPSAPQFVLCSNRRKQSAIIEVDRKDLRWKMPRPLSRWG